MAQSPVISRERAAAEPISEAVKLSDALLGVIRVRVNEKKPPLIPGVARYRQLDAMRRMVRCALENAGIPFSRGAGDLSLNVREGALLTYRLAEDLTEYVWLPDISDRKKLMAEASARDWQFRYPPEIVA